MRSPSLNAGRPPSSPTASQCPGYRGGRGAQTELGLLLVTELKGLSQPALPVQESQGSGVTDTSVGDGFEKGPVTLGQAEPVLSNAPTLWLPTWVSPTFPSQTARAALLERPPLFPSATSPPTYAVQTPSPPSRLVLVHNFLHADTSREEKERKYATIRIKGLGGHCSSWRKSC